MKNHIHKFTDFFEEIWLFEQSLHFFFDVNGIALTEFFEVAIVHRAFLRDLIENVMSIELTLDSIRKPPFRSRTK